MSSVRSHLIVASNRLPIMFSSVDGELRVLPASGGLTSALKPLLKDHGGTWVGSAGTEDSPQIRRLLEEAAQAFQYDPLFLSEAEQKNFYEGFSNEILWPLFHDLQSRCHFNPRYWEFYLQVNRKFAEAIERVSRRSSDLIWIQDYQLMQVAKILRARRPESRLAFFLHIPFPSPDIFEKLPWRREILEGLLEHDLIGVQTERDERNLIACVRAYVSLAKITRQDKSRIITVGHRKTRVQFFPISIDYEEFASCASSRAVLDRRDEIKRGLRDVQVVLGIDRLDYTKGIPERLRAFRSFLKNHPEFHRKVKLIQIVIPSREGIPGYQRLKREVERLVGRVNGEFSEPGWIPINYIHRSISREELLAIYCVADVALITPLKDGMNLVAKEYCAARTGNNGVLVLSEFAGAAAELGGGAILVNPYDQANITAALKEALEMPPEQRRRRMLRMRSQIRQANILKWRDRFFEAIDQAGTRS